MDEFLATTKRAGHNAELERLANNHAVFKDVMNGQLVLAPIDLHTSGKRILDSATADGTWLRDLRSSVLPAEHTYFGNDIEPELFPDDPQGMEFFRQNIVDPWPDALKGSFDLVHQRLGLAGSHPMKPGDVIANLAGLVKPGGWLQLVELDSFTSPATGPALTDVLRLMKEMFLLIGLGDYINDMKAAAERAGLRNVQEHKILCEVGALAKPELREKSANGMISAVAPLVAAAVNLPTAFEKADLESLESRLRAEMDREGGRYEVRAVWGQQA